MKDMTGRARRIVSAINKVRTQLGSMDGGFFRGRSEKVVRTAKLKKLESLENSLANLREFGLEEPPTGNPVGVEIGVPMAGGN